VTTAQQDAERASELAALREAVRDLIEGSGGIAPARRRLSPEPPADPGYDAQAWRLLGTEMGYKVEKLAAQFVFNNPNQTSACGCGESVAITPASPDALPASA